MTALTQFLRHLEWVGGRFMNGFWVDAQLHKDLIQFQGIDALCAQPSDIKGAVLVEQIAAVMLSIARNDALDAAISPVRDPVNPAELQLLPHLAHNAEKQ